MKKLCFIFSSILIFSGAASAIDVTVYNQDLGLIREVRPYTLKKGANDLTILDVAASMDATSVHFKSLADPEGVSVIELNFQYDLISQDKLLDKYIGKEITLERFLGSENGKKEIIKGTLLSTVRWTGH